MSDEIFTKRKYESARQLARQASILASARQMLAEVGYHATTIRGLAERAGVAPGTLYNLYNSKDELVLAAVEDLLIEIGITAGQNVEAGIDAIMNLGDALAITAQDNPEYAQAMARALFKVEPDDPLVELLYARSLPFYEYHLKIAQQKDELIDDVDLNILSKHLVAQSWSIILGWVMGLFATNAVLQESQRSQLLCLMGYTKGPRKDALQSLFTKL